MPKPKLYGTDLEIVQASEHNLPAGCVWIKARTIAEAYRKMKKQVVDGKNCTAIWVPPKTKSFTMARDFFASTVGELANWHFNFNTRSPKALREKVARAVSRKDFMAVTDKAARRGISADFYRAARGEIEGWVDAIQKYSRPRGMLVHLQSEKGYSAHPLSYKIHADSSGSAKKGFRLLINYDSDSALLYDSRDLVATPDEEDFLTFKPRGKKLRAWSPPDNAVVMITYSTMKRPFYAAHSAKGPALANHTDKRVLAKINADFT
jgi:hypothetical protein